MTTESLQVDLGALQQWSSKWGMSFNPSKCNIICINQKKNPLMHTYHVEEVDIVIYLGINFTNDFTWHNEVAGTASTGRAVLRGTSMTVPDPERKESRRPLPVLE